VIIPLDKLLRYNSNKYIFTRATMESVEKIGNIRKFPDDDTKWKVVPNILRLVLQEDVKFVYNKPTEEEQD
jgi:hypothetical protein